MNKEITFDLDDFLYYCLATFTSHVNNNSGSDFSVNDITTYDYRLLTAPNGISPKGDDLTNAMISMVDNDEFRTLKIIDGARKLTERVKKEGLNISIITARVLGKGERKYNAINDKIKDDTFYSLREHGICYDEIYFVSNKFDLIKKIKPIAHGDDAIKHLRYISCHKILMDSMHNKKEKAYSVSDFSNKPSRDKIIRVHDHEGTCNAIKACMKFY